MMTPKLAQTLLKHDKMEGLGRFLILTKKKTKLLLEIKKTKTKTKIEKKPKIKQRTLWFRKLGLPPKKRLV